MRRQKLIGQLLSDNFVSPNELRRHYDANPDKFTTEARYRFRHIIISKSDVTTLRERLQAIDADIAKGREFADLARDFSDGPRADRGGLYDVTDAVLNDWLEAIASAVRSLGEGEVSPRIVTSQGVHYVMLEKRTTGERLSFEEAQRQIERSILMQRRQARYVEFVSRLREEAKNDIRVYIDAPK